jgi:uncharacterized protein YciI
MQFLVIGLDGDDAGAAARRETARPQHIAMGEKLRQAGHLWFGAALFDDADRMNGSMYLVDFPGRGELDAWLETEPYMAGDVWRRIEIHNANVRDPWQFSRDKEFYDGRTSR